MYKLVNSAALKARPDDEGYLTGENESQDEIKDLKLENLSCTKVGCRVV